MNTVNLTELQAECDGLFSPDELQLILAEPAPRPDMSVIRASFLETYHGAAEILNQLDMIGTGAELAHGVEVEPIALPAGLSWPTYAEPEYQHRTRTDRRGITWDFLPADRRPMSGDEIEEGGIWRPRPSINQCASRYDRAVFQRVEAQRHHDATLAQHGPDAVATRAAMRKLQDAWQAQREALKASDDPTIQERDRIDAWRADAGREEYNSRRRTTNRGANADLSSYMSDEERAEHKRAQARERQRKAREKAKAAKVFA